MVKPHARWLHPLVVALAAILPYLAILGNGFVWDDHVLIENNPALARPLAAFGEFVAIGQQRTPYYRPVAVLWWFLLRNLLGLGPAGFHAVSILLHAGSAVLVLLIARRLLAPGAALLAGLLFALHPAHVEPVAFASTGPTELLPSALMLAGLLALLPPGGRVGAPGLPSPARVWTAAALAFLASLAKEPAALFAAVGLIALAAPRPGVLPRWRATARIALPLFVAPAVYAGMRLWLARPETMGRAAIVPHDPAIVPTWLLKVATYLVLPLEPVPYHVLQPLGAGGVVLLLALGLGAALVLRPLFTDPWRRCALWIGCGLFLVPLVPTFPLVPRGGAEFAERFLFLPSAGFCILAAAAVPLPGRDSPRWRVVATAAAAALVALTTARISGFVVHWRDDATLFSRALELEPDNANLLLVRGSQLLAAGDAAGAEPFLLRAQALRPRAGEVRLALARVAQARGRTAAARAAYQALLEDTRLRPVALMELGLLQAQAGEGDLGEAEFAEAVRLDPLLVDAHLNLGEIAWRRGDRDAARGHWERGLAVAPRDAALLYDLGIDAQERGDWALARELYGRALEADPRLEPARRQLERLPPAP
ncbi:MAG TPA: tetratricopeptide repeat protein [Candidatus Methanoperedens sp.]|nr:tetratricopeptide repeat protein [Candidatus Methanoperedens sp.]